MVRVLFAGTPEAAVPSLRKLAHDTEHFEVVAVLTRLMPPRGVDASSCRARSSRPRWNWDCRSWNAIRAKRRSSRRSRPLVPSRRGRGIWTSAQGTGARRIAVGVV